MPGSLISHSSSIDFDRFPQGGGTDDLFGDG